MNGVNQGRWWESLRHFGLLLAPEQVAALESDHQAEPLPWYRIDQLRRELNRREAGEVDTGQFVAWVLDKLCGFEGRDGVWTRGSSVSTEWSQTLIAGDVSRPRHVWTSHQHGALPVFIDSSPRLGIGRGRKAISDCTQWLRKAGRPLALVTNGQQWRLIYAGLDFEAGCEWDTDLWFEEGEPGPQLEALRLLLQPALLSTIDEAGLVPLASAVQDSRKGQSDLSSILGERVREAVEALVRSHGAALVTMDHQADGADIYRAAVRVVMRMVVVLFAESRDLLPRSEPIYESGYGLQGLFNALQRVAVRGRTRLNHRVGAWPRVLALFRLIYNGADHPDLGVPAYGGELFAPGDLEDSDPVNRALVVFERACFDPQLEPVADIIVYDMLELLTRTQVRVRQGRSTVRTMVPVDFAGLSTEYIGVLYEGLLDYELRTAPNDDPVVFLAVGNEPALPLSVLEAMEERQIRQLFEALKDTSKDSDEDGSEEEEATATEATEDDAALEGEGVVPEEVEEEADEVTDAESARQRALTWARQASLAAGLVKKSRGRQTPEREQAFEQQLQNKARQLTRRVVQPGEWFLVRWGGTRKGAGTFYTRPQLAVPTVHRTLRPLAYEPPQVKDDVDVDTTVQEWTPRRPEEILALKVCDPGCGSGSFLVASSRFLTDALFAALYTDDRLKDDWRRPLDELLGLGRSDTDEALQALRLPCPPDDEDFERATKAILRRYVVERCIYGVDLDPLAVELCRLALWVETMDRDLPFSFLDHKIKCGNSLVGAWFDQFRHYPAMAWKNREGGDKTHNNGVHFQKGSRGTALREFFKEELAPDLAASLRRQIELSEEVSLDAARVHDDLLVVLESLHGLPVQDAEEHARRYREEFLGSKEWRLLKSSFDMWCACWFWPADELKAAPLPSGFTDVPDRTREVATRIAGRQRFFHWELEFPDVFRQKNSGFDAVVGNPPWETMQPNSREYFSNIDPLYQAYGKQDALRKQTEHFANEAAERAWLNYNADYADFSNWMKHAFSPFGDPDSSERATERLGLVRGAKNESFHAEWREVRSRSTGYADAGHPYRHRGEGKAYTYKLFLEHAHSLLTDDGRLGFIVPSGLYSDHGTKALRELFLKKCRWEWLFGFENGEKIFDIHRSFKFNAVIVTKGHTTASILTSFMRRRLEDWEVAESHATPYERKQVDQFSPKSKSILEIQSSRDLEILEKIYANSVLLGDEGRGGWGIKYAQGDFNMTSDSALFPPRPQWEEKGYQPDEYSRWLKGEWNPRTGTCPAPPGATRVEIREGIILSRDGEQWINEAQIEDVALPLYQGAMVHQFDPSVKRWVSGTGLRAVWETIPWEQKVIAPQFLMSQQKYHEGSRYPGKLRLGFRDIARTTDQRTLIACLVPNLPCGNKVPTLLTSTIGVSALQCVLNSFAFDWTQRIRQSAASVNYFVLEEAPVARVSRRTLEILCNLGLRLGAASSVFAPYWGSQGLSWCECWALTRHERLRLRCTVEAIVSLIFGLTASEMKWMLRGCDLPTDRIKGESLPANGFWRVDRGIDPESRLTVLSIIAYTELLAQVDHHGGDAEAAITSFVGGGGWRLPEAVTLADYDLGHDERARKSQALEVKAADRFLPWQLGREPSDLHAERELHARNLLGHDKHTEMHSDDASDSTGDPSASEQRQLEEDSSSQAPVGSQGQAEFLFKSQ
jgi:hypothetical protein